MSETLALNRTIRPSITSPVAFDVRLKPYECIRLDNGVPVYFLRANHYETIYLDIVFPAGEVYASHVLEAATTNALMKSGTSAHSAREINETIEFYGAYLDAYAESQVAGYGIYMLGKHLPALLPLLFEILTDPVFPEEEIHLYQQTKKQQLRINLKKSDVVADRLIDEVLFGKTHPYGRAAQESDYDSLHRDMLKSFHHQHYVLPAAKIFMAGKIEDGVLGLLNQYFGQSASQHAPATPTVPPPAPAATHQLKHTIDEQALQAAVRIARVLPGYEHEDFNLLSLLNVVLGGYFGSRLMSNIREEKGYTYGIHSLIYPNDAHYASWLVTAEVGRQVAEATAHEVYHEFRRLIAEPVPQEELLMVKNYLIGSLLGRLDGPVQQIKKWRSLILKNQSEQDYVRQIQTFKTATSDDLLDVAKRWLLPDEFYEVMVF